MRYEDITEGDTVSERVIEDVRDEDMRLVSALFDDPNPIHFDPQVVEEQGHPGLVNQGPINMSYVTQAALDVAKSPSDLKSLQVRLEDNVYKGETVTARAKALDKRKTDGAGTVELELELEKDDGTVAVTGSATVRLPTG